MTRIPNLPAPIGQPSASRGERILPPENAKAGVFDAQLLGQDGIRRGLKGGTPVLEAARSAYLGAEWSGPVDRRLSTGLIMRSKA